MTGVFEYLLEPQGTGTLVRLTCDVKPHGWMWLTLPLLIRETRIRYRDQLSNLKQAMQAEPPATPTVSEPRKA